jgi:hypothetical protein
MLFFYCAPSLLAYKHAEFNFLFSHFLLLLGCELNGLEVYDGSKLPNEELEINKSIPSVSTTVKRT